MKPPSTSVEGDPSPRHTDTLIPCPICSSRFSSPSGLKRHLAGHNRNPTAHLAHLFGANGFKCNDCIAEFGTQIGLSQHRRRVHPAEYNDEKLARRPVSQYNWSTLEDVTLRNMATELYESSGTKKALYTKLASMFPNRSAEAIKKRLQHLSWNPPSQPLPSTSHHNTDVHSDFIITTPADSDTNHDSPPPQTAQQLIRHDNDSAPQPVISQTVSPLLHFSRNDPAPPTELHSQLTIVTPPELTQSTLPTLPLPPTSLHNSDVHSDSITTTPANSDTNHNSPPSQSAEQFHHHDNDSVSQPVISQTVSPSLHLSRDDPAPPNELHSQHIIVVPPEPTNSILSFAPTSSVFPTDSQQNTTPPTDFVLDPTHSSPCNLFTGNLEPAELNLPYHSPNTQFDIHSFPIHSHQHPPLIPPDITTQHRTNRHNRVTPRATLSKLPPRTAPNRFGGKSSQRTLTSMWGCRQNLPTRTPPRHPSPEHPGATANCLGVQSQAQQRPDTSIITGASLHTPSTCEPIQHHSPTPPSINAVEPLPTTFPPARDSAQDYLSFTRALTISPSLADAVLTTQSPLDLCLMSSDNHCHSPTDYSDRPAWLIDETSMELLQAAREQIRDCPPTDQLSDLSLLLQDSNLISLDGFRDRLEQLCDRRFPFCWKYRKRRYGRRVSFRNTRQLRRIQFGHIQNLYRRSRKDAASTILDGRWRNAYLENDFKFSDFNNYWLNILRGQRIIDTRPPRTLLPREDNLAAPITPAEVTRALGNMDGTAPGPDRLTPNDLRRYRPASLSALFNSFLLSGVLPKSLNLARVTFVPKVPLPMTPSDFRPISITSVVTRCFHKILFDRWSRLFPLDRQQFGFLRRDGCFEMTSILHSTLRYCHLASKSISFANIDISKAFDNVSHDSLLRAASSFGAPPVLLDYLRNVYSSGMSFFDNFSFSPQRGVRQGDPLSPLLFIMCLDEALSNSYDPNLVFHSPGGDLDYLAYADDVILFTESREALAVRMERLQSELNAIGLSINMLKSSSTHILADGHRKTTMLDNRPLIVDNNNIPVSTVSSTWQVLGIPFNWKGKLPTTAISETSRMLEEVSRAPLKPQQRVEILRSHLIPRLIHQLTLGVVHLKTLSNIDSKIRAALRRWLRLPTDTSKAFFYSGIDVGGLGIPHLSSRIPLNRKARLDRHLATNNGPLHWALREPSSQPFFRLALRTTIVGGDIITNKQEAAAAWCKSLWNTLDGAGLRNSPTIPQAHNWLRYSERIPPSTYIRALKLRAGVLPTKCRRSRGRPTTTEQLNCRCHSAVESISHLLQTCPITHDVRCRRHNEIMNQIGRLLRQKRFSFLVEPHIPHSNTYVKPDLVVFKGDTVHIMDIAICDPHRMTSSLKQKKDKYGSPETNKHITDYLRGWNRNFTRIVQTPIIFNNRGFLHPDSARSLLSLGISKTNLGELCLQCIRGSLKIYDTYMRGCDPLQF